MWCLPHTVPPEYPSGELGKEGFQKEGRDYVREAVLKVKENYVTESRLASQTVTVSHEGREGAAARFVPFLDYENGGYQGQLTLDASTIFTEAAGTQSYSYPLSETREYTGLQRNDTYYIPKSVLKNGVTLALADVEWTAMGDGTYRAQARYAGTGYGSRTTGYLSTGAYVGTVERKTLESVTYKVIYAGKPLPVVKPSLWPWILGWECWRWREGCCCFSASSPTASSVRLRAEPGCGRSGDCGSPGSSPLWTHPHRNTAAMKSCYSIPTPAR